MPVGSNSSPITAARTCSSASPPDSRPPDHGRTVTRHSPHYRQATSADADIDVIDACGARSNADRLCNSHNTDTPSRSGRADTRTIQSSSNASSSCRSAGDQGRLPDRRLKHCTGDFSSCDARRYGVCLTARPKDVGAIVDTFSKPLPVDLVDNEVLSTRRRRCLRQAAG